MAVEAILFSHESIKEEKTTIRAMVQLYCRHHHKGERDGLCSQCDELLEYAFARLSKCPLTTKTSMFEVPCSLLQNGNV